MATEINYRFVPLAEVRNQPLSWIQVNTWKQCYELRAGEHLVAVMQWDGMFKTSATVESAEGTWHLTQHGFFKVHTDLQVQDRLEPTLMLHNSWNGGELTVSDGRELRWRTANFWGTKNGFFDHATEQPLIMFHYRGWFTYNADITLDSEAQSLPNLLMLLSLGWYQLILHMMSVN